MALTTISCSCPYLEGKNNVDEYCQVMRKVVAALILKGKNNTDFVDELVRLVVAALNLEGKNYESREGPGKTFVVTALMEGKNNP